MNTLNASDVNEANELDMMVACLLRRMTFRDSLGRRLLLTGFKSSTEATMSVIDEQGRGTGQVVCVSSLEGLVKDE